MGTWNSNPDGSAAYNPDAQSSQPAAGASGQPGWGPIKISGQFTPHPNSPGDFWHHIGSMHPGQASGQGPGAGGSPWPDAGPGGMTGHGPGMGGPSQGGGFDPNAPLPPSTGPGGIAGGFLPNPGFDLRQLLGQQPSIPMPEGKTYDDFQKDYWAPDRDQVLAGLPQPPLQHFNEQTMPNAPTQGNQDLLQQLLQRSGGAGKLF